MGMSESPLILISHIYLTSLISIREARVIFKAGKNRDGFFDANDLLRQVDKAIDIFEGLTKGWAQGLFIFDNAPSHQRRAPDAISARNMVKGAPTLPVSHHHPLLAPASPLRVRSLSGIPADSSLTGPREGWAH